MIKIHGKDYVLVNERVIDFRKNHPLWAIESEIISNDGKIVVIRSMIKDETGRIISTGIASEEKNSSKINSTNHIENCETSAVGRCIGFLGYGIDTSIASADEVYNAIEKQDGLANLKMKLQGLLETKILDDKQISYIMKILVNGKREEIEYAIEKASQCQDTEGVINDL